MIRRGAANVRPAVDRVLKRFRRCGGAGPFRKAVAVCGVPDSLPPLPGLVP